MSTTWLQKLLQGTALLAATTGLMNSAFSQSTTGQCAVGRDILYFVDNSTSVEVGEYQQVRTAIRTSMSQLRAVAGSGDRVAVVNWAQGNTAYIQTALNWTAVADLTTTQLSDANFPCRSYGYASGQGSCGSTASAGSTNMQNAFYLLSVALTQPNRPTIGVIETSQTRRSIDPLSDQSPRKLVIVNISDASTTEVSQPSPTIVANVFQNPPVKSTYLFTNIFRGTEGSSPVEFRNDFRASLGRLNATIVSVGFKPGSSPARNNVLPFLSATSSISPNQAVGDLAYDCVHSDVITTQANDRTCVGSTGGNGSSNTSSRRRLATYSDEIVAADLAELIRTVLVESCPALTKSYIAAPALSTSAGVSGTDVGGTITYTLAVANRNAQQITVDRLTDIIPINTVFVNATDGGDVIRPTAGFPYVQWGPLTISPNATLRRSFTVRIPVDISVGVTEIVNDQYEAVIRFDAESAPTRVNGARTVTPIIRRTGSLTGNPSTTKTFDGQNTTLTRQFQITDGDLVNCTTVPVPAGNPYPRVEVGTTTVEFDCTGIAVRQACTPACFVEVTRRALTGLTITPLQFFEGEPIAVQVSANNVVNNYPVAFAVRYGPESETCATITNATPPVAPGRYRVCASPITTGPSANYSGTADAILTIAPRVIISPVALANVGSLEGIAFSVTGGAAATSSIVLTLVPPPGACPVNCSVNLAALGPTGPCNANTSGQIICTATQGVPGVSCDRSARRCSIATLPGNGSIPLFVGTRGSAGGSLVGTLVTLAVGASPPSTCRLTATSCDSVATQGEL